MAELILQQRCLTVSEYHAMAEAGILEEDERIELLDGRLVEMSPIGPRHFHCVNRLTQLFAERVYPNAIVSVQNPVRLNDLSEPGPDVVLLRPDLDTSRIAEPEDVLLLVEVADSTLEKDRRVKLVLYAQAGIPEVWIVALPEDTIEVYREPDGQRYKQMLLRNRMDGISIEALPDVHALSVAEILG